MSLLPRGIDNSAARTKLAITRSLNRCGNPDASRRDLSHREGSAARMYATAKGASGANAMFPRTRQRRPITGARSRGIQRGTIGVARTVLLIAAMGYIWTVAGRDVLLTQHLVKLQGSAVEANCVAQKMTTHFGPAALLPYKAVTLAIFTLVVAMLAPRRRETAEALVGVGVVVYGALAMWWDWIVMSWVRALGGI